MQVFEVPKSTATDHSAGAFPNNTALLVNGGIFDQNIYPITVTTLEAPAGQPFKIAFSNNDSGVQHNVEIKKADGSSAFRGEIVTGVTTITYDVPALEAGAYTFNCTVHPAMTGTLTVH